MEGLKHQVHQKLTRRVTLFQQFGLVTTQYVALIITEYMMMILKQTECYVKWIVMTHLKTGMIVIGVLM